MNHTVSGSPPMPEAVAFFLTWTTYGTWLPGDERGWVERGKGQRPAEPSLRRSAERALSESPCTLTTGHRKVVESTIRAHCKIREWQLHAVAVRSNHVHVVVSAREKSPEDVASQLKPWSTRKLKEADGDSRRLKWWTERGSCRYISDNESLESVMIYVSEAQDRKLRDSMA